MRPLIGSGEDFGSRTSNCPSPSGVQGSGGITPRPQAARRSRAGHKGRFVPGSVEPRLQRRGGCGPPAYWGRAHAGWVSKLVRLFTQEENAPPQPGKEPATDDSRAGLRRVTHAFRKPPLRPSPGRPPTWEGSVGAFHPPAQPPVPTPPRLLRWLCVRRFAQRARRLTWEPGHEGAEPKEAGVQGRPGPWHGGGARLNDGAGCGLRGGVRSRLVRGVRVPGATAACPARSRDSQ